jgi:uncharacterized protein YjbI with pentapeptide repeats
VGTVFDKENKSQPPDDSAVTLSTEEIELLVSWRDERRPYPSPIGRRYLTRQDIQQAVEVWKKANGEPQFPIGDYWQAEGRWRQGPNLAEMDLANRNLANMNLAGIIFTYANLQHANLSRSDLRGAWLWRANLQQAFCGNANLMKANFYEANLTDAEFWKAKLNGASFRGAVLERTRLLDADLSGAYFHRARLNNTEMMASQLGDAIGEELDRNYHRALEAYARLKANFESIGRYADAGWAYRKERRMKKRLAGQQASDSWKKRLWGDSARNSLTWAQSWFIEILCDYGESLWRVIGWMAFLLFLMGPVLIWIFGGLEWTGTNRDIYLKLPTWLQWFYAYLQYFLYMLDTFTTASFSELKPHNDAVRLISGLMSMSGIILAGLLGFVAGNRIRNS